MQFLLMTLAVGIYPVEIEALPPLEDLRRFPPSGVVDTELKLYNLRRKELLLQKKAVEFIDQEKYNELYELNYDLESQAERWRKLQQVYRSLPAGTDYIWGLTYYPGSDKSEIKKYEGKQASRFYLACFRDWLGRSNYNAGVLPSLYFVEKKK